MDIQEKIKKAQESGVTLYRIHKESGLAYSTVRSASLGHGMQTKKAARLEAALEKLRA